MKDMLSGALCMVERLAARSHPGGTGCVPLRGKPSAPTAL